MKTVTSTPVDTSINNKNPFVKAIIDKLSSILGERPTYVDKVKGGKKYKWAYVYMHNKKPILDTLKDCQAIWPNAHIPMGESPYPGSIAIHIRESDIVIDNSECDQVSTIEDMANLQ